MSWGYFVGLANSLNAINFQFIHVTCMFYSYWWLIGPNCSLMWFPIEKVEFLQTSELHKEKKQTYDEHSQLFTRIAYVVENETLVITHHHLGLDENDLVGTSKIIWEPRQHLQQKEDVTAGMILVSVSFKISPSIIPNLEHLITIIKRNIRIWCLPYLLPIKYSQRILVLDIYIYLIYCPQALNALNYLFNLN